MSIAQGLSGIFEDPSLINRENTWSQRQVYDGTVRFNNTVGLQGNIGNIPGVHFDSFAASGFSPGGNLGFYLAPEGLGGGIYFNTSTYLNGSGRPGIAFQVNGGELVAGLGIPTLSEPTIASGTVYQNTSYSYSTIYIPVYAATAGTAGTAALALGTTDTPSTIFTQYVSGDTSSTSQQVITVRIPPQWYYSVTTTGATIGTVTQVQE